MIRDAKVLQQGKVKIHLAGATQVAMPGISKLAGEQLTRGQRRQDEGCRVEETVQCLFSGRAAAECRLKFCTEGEIIRVVNAIRPPAGSRVSRIEGKTRIVRLTAARRRNPGNLPTA